jgi:ATP-dependent helicase/nuclease subunit B
MLLPTLRPIAQVEDEALELSQGAEPLVRDALDLPPAISGTRRQMLLARLILQFGRGLVREGVEAPDTPDQAVRLATALAKLIDEVQTQDLDFSGLDGLVVDRFAHHWQETLRFLRIVTKFWPDLLDEIGATDPKIREFALMRAQAQAWTVEPPQDPVIVAGSTGSVPATAELMRVVAGLPQGAVILPGLDTESDAVTWAAIRGDPSHPQNGLARLLEQFDMTRADVQAWGRTQPVAGLQARLRMIREAMRPSETTDAWRRLQTAAPELTEGNTFAGITRIEAEGPRQEAGAIAVALREVAETPGKTAALITTDRTLARRVRAELRRWGLDVDDSGGSPLAETPPAVFLHLISEAAAQDAAPVPLLSLLKHPLAAGGLSVGQFRSRTRTLERRILRGPRPGSGFTGLREALHQSLRRDEERKGEVSQADRDEVARLLRWIDDLEDRLGPLFNSLSGDATPPAAFLEAHVTAAERLADTDEVTGDTRLWRGDAGEMLAALIAELQDALPGLEPIRGSLWPGLFGAVLEGRQVRARARSHPRLQILGALEARLQHFDRVILGGLVEGSWPREPEPDPWMSRPMRKSFGLPEPERRIGLSAHDFAMALTADEVILTRSLRADGAPTVSSRWIRRMETVAKSIEESFRPTRRLLDLAALLDRPADWRANQSAPDQAPRPPSVTPPIAARPRRLPVTDIQTWLEDPYSLYAKRILKLRALDPLDQEPGAADRGSAIHAALDRLVREHPSGPLPADAYDQLVVYGEEAFGELISNPTVAAFWWPRYLRVARWFVETEGARRATLDRSWTERRGSVDLAGPAGPFELYGYADRIDRMQDGGFSIIDYKTGTRPTKKQLETGLAPQLPLEALMLSQGGFEDVPAGTTEELAYWRLTGGEEPGKIDAATKDMADLIAQARQGLEVLIETFDDETTAYHAIPNPARAPRFNDYEHLARVLEWGGEEGEDV